jgi:hypothetical protein
MEECDADEYGRFVSQPHLRVPPDIGQVSALATVLNHRSVRIADASLVG